MSNQNQKSIALREGQALLAAGSQERGQAQTICQRICLPETGGRRISFFRPRRKIFDLRRNFFYGLLFKVK
jgi:hypothetical protein